MLDERGATLPPRADDAGFALAVVVFLLFAIAVAAATGYRVVQTESRLAVYSADATKALAIAHAGAQYTLGEDAPDLSTERTIQIDGGEAHVSARRVFEPGFPNEIRLLTSRGSFADPRFEATPARRTVRQYVRYQRAPLNVLAGVAATGPIVVKEAGPGPTFTLFPIDRASASVCPEAPRDLPAAREWVPLDSLDVPWGVLTDPDFPVDYQDELPPGGIEGTVSRVAGDLVVSTASPNRQGILIVTGSLIVEHNFRWDGIVLVGGDVRIGSMVPGQENAVGSRINGVLAAGLNGDAPATIELLHGALQLDSCEILGAGAPLTRVIPLRNSWWEVH